MINVPLMRKTLDYIEHNPEDWDQDMWGARYERGVWSRQHSMTPCATACCFAGNAVLLAGGDFVEVYRHAVEVDGVHYENAADAAYKLLGLTWKQADALFDECNSLDDLRRLVGEYITEAESAP